MIGKMECKNDCTDLMASRQLILTITRLMEIRLILMRITTTRMESVAPVYRCRPLHVVGDR